MPKLIWHEAAVQIQAVTISAGLLPSDNSGQFSRSDTSDATMTVNSTITPMFNTVTAHL